MHSEEWIVKWKLLGKPRIFEMDELEMFVNVPEELLHVEEPFGLCIGSREVDGIEDQMGITVGGSGDEYHEKGTHPDPKFLVGWTWPRGGHTQTAKSLPELLKKLHRELFMIQRPSDGPEIKTALSDFARNIPG